MRIIFLLLFSTLNKLAFKVLLLCVQALINWLGSASVGVIELLHHRLFTQQVTASAIVKRPMNAKAFLPEKSRKFFNLNPNLVYARIRRRSSVSSDCGSTCSSNSSLLQHVKNRHSNYASRLSFPFRQGSVYENPSNDTEKLY